MNIKHIAKVQKSCGKLWTCNLVLSDGSSASSSPMALNRLHEGLILKLTGFKDQGA